MKKVLVMAVHPDDETLGCGGTLLKHKAAGDDLFWLIATDTAKEYGPGTPAVKRRQKEIKRVAAAYGFTDTFRLCLPAKSIDIIPVVELITKISAVIEKVKPETVYLPFQGDVHSDHRYFFNAAYSCLKTFRNPFIKTVLMMETISETEFALTLEENTFIPNYFVDISRYFKTKLEIMAVYKNEIQKHPFPRSKKNIEALAIFRGAMANCFYAESFMLLKGIV
ncbi:MAG: PIG-L deacetylase family protein [Phycisphaerae bacterium]|jgi:LmbE family N-acetylglucosaminyl deacetylase